MTLISTPVDLSPLYNYPHSNLHSTDDNYSLAHAPALSWLQPATAPTPSSSKYRTLASIQAQSLHQQQQHLTLAQDLHSTAIAKKQPRQPTITAAIQQMDNSHGTCFLPWIHNPSNLDYISLRLRPLCLEYPLVDVANVLRWIGADWSSVDCKALFRAVTQSWDPARRRMLAFLLIRDEEMRQKAKSKLVEFAQKTGTRTSDTVSVQDSTIDLAALEALVASAMITGLDVTLPATAATTITATTTTTITGTTTSIGACAPKTNAISGGSYQRRYSPY
ncbi:hypothetical protein BGZ68_010913 [Mortierella alpina]|nr:hypothetical protein BGZ68_010913 [Mortierella alpina]